METPFETEALVEKAEAAAGAFPYGTVDTKNGSSFAHTVGKDEHCCMGCGEANRGIDKRGYCYIGWCTDDPESYRRRNALCTVPTILLFSAESRRLDCFLIIREN